MKFVRVLSVVLSLMLLAPAALLLADEPGTNPQPESAPPPEVVSTPVAPSGLAQRISEIIATEKADVAELSALIDATRDPRQVLTLQRRVQLVKVRAEKQVLELQLAVVRPKTTPDELARLEQAIAALDELEARTISRLPDEKRAADSRR